MLTIISKDNCCEVAGWKPKISGFLSILREDYPGFEKWLKRVFIEIPLGRRVVVLDTDNGVIRGLAILKNTTGEKKVCTLRVGEKYRRQGIGTRLLRESYRILGTDRPLLTVSERNIDSFMPFLAKEGFELTSVVKYGSHRREFCFNEQRA